MTKTKVSMDNCGFETIIEAITTDEGMTKLTINSRCQSIQKIAQELDEIDPFQIIGRPVCECLIYKIANGYLRHTACLVPPAIIRTIEVEAGMALAGDSSVKIER
jgi:hypothetical protein